jgi:CheY-like chemotaxis protein
MAKRKVLVVDANPDSRAALTKALGDAGYEVAAAGSGSFALTMLEWERPDLIVSYAKVQDMDGYELFTMVRRDPATKETPFLLLAGRDRPIALAATEAGVDMTVTGDFTLATVLARVGDLLGHPVPEPAPRAARHRPGRGAAEPVPAASPPPRAGVEAPRATFQGSLGVMDLTEVAQAVALGGKTGRLVLSMSGGEGVIVFEAGRVIHAEFAGRTGEAAFTALVTASQHELEARFCFNRAERAELAQGPRTIQRSLEQLLLSTAALLDEHTGLGEPSHPLPAPGEKR